MLELVLQKLAACDLAQCTRVSKPFRSAITGSKKLRTTLWLDESTLPIASGCERCSGLEAPGNSVCRERCYQTQPSFVVQNSQLVTDTELHPVFDAQLNAKLRWHLRDHDLLPPSLIVNFCGPYEKYRQLFNDFSSQKWKNTPVVRPTCKHSYIHIEAYCDTCMGEYEEQTLDCNASNATHHVIGKAISLATFFDSLEDTFVAMEASCEENQGYLDEEEQEPHSEFQCTMTVSFRNIPSKEMSESKA